MPKKISDLTAKTTLNNTDSFVLSDGVLGSDRRITKDDLVNALDMASIEYVDDKASLPLAINGSLQGEAVSAEGGLRLSSKRKRKPLVTFIDDDGRTELYTHLKPIFEAQGVPLTLALYSDYHNETNPGGITREQILELQNELGWEIASHSVSHANLTEVTPAQLDVELKESREVFESFGVEIENFIYPYGANNKAVRDATRKYYRSGANVTGSGNVSPLNTYNLTRRDFSGGTGEADTSKTYAHYKGQVDNAIANNKYLIFTTHSDRSTNFEEVYEDKDGILVNKFVILDQIIDYIKSQNVEILNLNDALDIYGNVIDHGDQQDRYFRVGGDGEVDFVDYNRISTKLPADTTEPTDAPTVFPEGKISYVELSFNYANSVGYPSGGVLVTDRTAPIELNRGTYQYFNSLSNSEAGILVRRWNNSADTWTEWEPISGNGLSKTVRLSSGTSGINPSSTKPITDYELGNTSVERLVNSSDSGFPNNFGLLFTKRLFEIENNRYGNQEFHVFNSTDVYSRSWSGSVWRDWVLIASGNEVKQIEGEENPSSTKPITEYPIGQLTYERIRNSADSGFPNNYGYLFTQRLTDLDGNRFSHQLFYWWDSNRVDIRYWALGSSTWRDWERFSGGATGSFTTSDSKTVNVENGVITSIV